MIIVTGAAGFIGSCIVAKLNEEGRKDLVLVDQVDEDELKKLNLSDKSFIEFLDKEIFLNKIKNDEYDSSVEAIIHMGACSSTTLQDKDYFQKNNYEYTKILAQWALKHSVRFIYASSAATYGNGTEGYKDDIETIKKCKPLNLYGESKQQFDEWVLENDVLDKVVGLKFFNVFGPNEYHKDDMRSVVAKAYEGVVKEGKMFLFKSYKTDYNDGEQKRDFIYVKDAVEVVLFFLNNKEVNGIYNVGTGCARTWNDLANALFEATGKEPNIEYVEMPEVLKDKYQYFTQADMSKLKASGYSKDFTALEDAVKDYVSYLNTTNRW